MQSFDEYKNISSYLYECCKVLDEAVNAVRRMPFGKSGLLNDLETLLSQVARQRSQFESAVKMYEKEYGLYYSGSAKDNTELSRSADILEQVIRDTGMLLAQWSGMLSQIMSRQAARSLNQLYSAGDRFTVLKRSLVQAASAGTDRGQYKPASTEREEMPSSPALSKVQFSAIAPKEFENGQYMMLNIVMYEENFRHVVDEIIRDYEEKTQETKSGVLKVEEGSTIRIELTSPDYHIEDNEETGIWNGEYLNLSFVLMLPEDYRKNQVLYIAKVYINEILSTKLKFVIRRLAAAVQKPTVEREDFTSAFVSYASQDRKRVAGIIQGMQKARPDMDIFFDVESIRSGASWKDVLYEEILRRDILYLCWSCYAKESKWVDEEWRFALKNHGADYIDIVPLDQPELCPPPEELNDKHFNEKLLYIINSEQTK